MRGRYVALTVIALAVGGASGVWLERQRTENAKNDKDSGPKVLYWVAPMDPNFRKDGPGKSPMGMDLVPVYEGDEPKGDPEEIELSAAEINAIGVRTSVAQIEDVARRIDTVGFVGYDEHATSHIHMRVEGWIEKLKVRAVGDRVRAGDLLFDLYAPEITIASSELIRAVRRRDQTEITVARRKLRNFGVTPGQIDEMASAKTPAQVIRVYAPQDGVVIALAGADGMYLKPDIRALSLSDLSTVWLQVDVFERDIGLLTSEMVAEARFEHLPGRVFQGEIDYIFPELDPETRTLRVRLRYDNREGLLRPNMFANVTLTPRKTRSALTVPSEAVIRTGRAERVILKTAEGLFRPRLVTTGLRGGFGNGLRTEIIQGLGPGDEVVASAQFLIDSESALNAGLMRFAPTEAEPAAAAGTLLALDKDRRRATIRHEAIPAMDWPAMETTFAVRSDVALDRLSIGDAVKFRAFRGADGLLALSALGSDDGIDATGTGLVHAVTTDGRISLSHDPIPALGWPEMKMDMPVAGVDLAGIPLETPIEFDLAKGDDGLFTVVGVRPQGVAKAPPKMTEAASPIVVSGKIQSVDAENRTASIAHGPIKEIGMPGMTMAFAIDPALDMSSLPLDQEVTLTFARPDGLTMVLTAAKAVLTVMTVDGTINGVDATARTVNATHGPLAAIGMPGMTMDFPLGDGVDIAELKPGDAVLKIINHPDQGLIVIGAEPKKAPMKVMGTVNSVNADAKTANVTHGPLAAIGMPGMTMDFALSPDLDPATLPVGKEVALLLIQAEDLSLTLVGMEAAP